VSEATKGQQVATTFLSTLGIACIVAAIAGGGFSAAGISFPVINSLPRQVFLGILGLLLLILGLRLPNRERKLKKILRGALRDPERKWRQLTTLGAMAGLPVLQPNDDNAKTLRDRLIEIGARASPPSMGRPELWGLISRVGKTGFAQPGDVEKP
jgi:hypothetical protein